MTIQEIKKQRQDSTNKLLDECGVFFAFSNEQFEKTKHHSNPMKNTCPLEPVVICRNQRLNN